MPDKSIPAEIVDDSVSSFWVEQDMRLRKFATRTSMMQLREVTAVEHSDHVSTDLRTTLIMTGDMKNLVVGGPELTPDDWRNLVFILERRIDYCETQIALVGKIDKSSGEDEISNRRHFEGELADAQALFNKIDYACPLT